VNGLNIPAEVLLRERGAQLPPPGHLQEARRFPIAEMVQRRWFVGFDGSVAEAKWQFEDLMRAFLAPLGSNALLPTLNRQHVHYAGE
jgi:hypothetical protein